MICLEGFKWRLTSKAVDYGNTFTSVFVLLIFGIKSAKVVRQHGSTNPAMGRLKEKDPGETHFICRYSTHDSKLETRGTL